MTTAKLAMWGLMACAGGLAAVLNYYEHEKARRPDRKIMRYKTKPPPE